MESSSSCNDLTSAGSSSSYKKSNKIRDIVRLQQILKKWRKLAVSNSPSSATAGSEAAPAHAGGVSRTNIGSSKGIRFLKRTLSNLSDYKEKDRESNNAARKGYLAVSVGVEEKRFVIPTQYLSHQAFQALLREAEEEFGFEQEGLLRFPCAVAVFLNIVNAVDPNHNLVGDNDEGGDHHQGSSFGNACRFSFGDVHDHHDADENQSCATFQPPPPLCR